MNKISWYGGTPKYDIRDWASEHEKRGKDVTFNDEEFAALKEVTNKIKISEELMYGI